MAHEESDAPGVGPCCKIGWARISPQKTLEKLQTERAPREVKLVCFIKVNGPKNIALNVSDGSWFRVEEVEGYHYWIQRLLQAVQVQKKIFLCLTFRETSEQLCFQVINLADLSEDLKYSGIVCCEVGDIKEAEKAANSALGLYILNKDETSKSKEQNWLEAEVSRKDEIIDMFLEEPKYYFKAKVSCQPGDGSDDGDDGDD